MSKYTAISREEMEAFLFPQGFKLLPVPGTTELVYGKRVDANGLLLTLRVYSSIVLGVSREVGEDAIRVVLFQKIIKSKRIIKLGGSKKVLRVEGWRSNLQSRLDGWQEYLPAKTCCKCGRPMVLRQVRKGPRKGEPFLGCTGFPANCSHTEEVRQAA